MKFLQIDHCITNKNVFLHRICNKKTTILLFREKKTYDSASQALHELHEIEDLGDGENAADAQQNVVDRREIQVLLKSS